jgi:hypothetical protein
MPRGNRVVSLTVQDILQAAFPAYREAHALPRYVRFAAEQMMHCRTKAMGGHTEACPNGHVERVWYNSCKHRSCPQCAALQMEQWLERKQAQVLACDHYHVIFTLPEDLNNVWRYNRKVFTNLLFRSVRDTLVKLLGDAKYLGATPGMILALHTWGGQLTVHPHIHCLVTGGGLSAEGDWKKIVKDCLLPRKVLMAIFRGKFLDHLRRAADKGQLQPPAGKRLSQLKGSLNKLGRDDWNVKILDRYEHGNGVLKYLARYLRGGPISNRRLVSFDGGQVAFRYRDHRDVDEQKRPRWKTGTMAADEFLSRLLTHVPLPGCQTVRSYGLYANTKAEALTQAREALGQPKPESRNPVTWKEFMERFPGDHPGRCPVCGAALIRHSEFRRSRAPPPLPQVTEVAA